MENKKIIDLKNELYESVKNFNATKNKYFNSDFFDYINLSYLLNNFDINADLSVGQPLILYCIHDNNEEIHEKFSIVLLKTINSIFCKLFNLSKEDPNKNLNIESKISTLKEEFKKNQNTEQFNIYLNKIFIETSLKSSDVLCRSGIDKSYFYQILRGEKKPSKDKLIQIAIGLKLDIKETNELLARQGFILYGKTPRDFIILECIENQIYSINEIDKLLIELGVEPLDRLNKI